MKSLKFFYTYRRFQSSYNFSKLDLEEFFAFEIPSLEVLSITEEFLQCDNFRPEVLEIKSKFFQITKPITSEELNEDFNFFSAWKPRKLTLYSCKSQNSRLEVLGTNGDTKFQSRYREGTYDLSKAEVLESDQAFSSFRVQNHKYRGITYV